MIDAFVEVSDLARRAGTDEHVILAAHGRFFDGNVGVKDAFRVLCLLAEAWRPGNDEGPRRDRRYGPS